MFKLNLAEDIFIQIYRIVQLFLDLPFRMFRGILNHPVNLLLPETLTDTLLSLSIVLAIVFTVNNLINVSFTKKIKIRALIIRFFVTFLSILNLKIILGFFNALFSDLTNFLFKNSYLSLGSLLRLDYIMQIIINSDKSVFTKSFLLFIFIAFSVALSIILCIVLCNVIPIFFQKTITEVFMPIFLSTIGSKKHQEKAAKILFRYVSINIAIYCIYFFIIIIPGFMLNLKPSIKEFITRIIEVN